jgi:outer membrane protein
MKTAFLLFALYSVASASFGRQAGAQTNSQDTTPPSVPAHAALDPAGLSLLQVLQDSLSKNPQLHIQQFTVDEQAGELRTAKGQFDWALNGTANQQRSYTPLTAAAVAAYDTPGSGLPNVSSTVANDSTVNAQASKQFRSGVTITPSVSVSRTTDNINYPGGINQAQTNFQVVLPLLRNRGRKAIDAQEVSADKLLKASRMDLSQMVSDTLATAAIRYWTFVAADATVALYKDAEDRANSVLGNSQELVNADRLPANDLNQARANLASRVASRVGAEQNLLLAKQQLVLVMGLGAEQILALPAPAQDIPASVSNFDPMLMADYLKLANTARADVLAAQLRVDSNLVLQGAAQNQVKPQLDVSGTVGYTGLREGTNGFDYPASLFSAPKGADFTIGIVYNQSPANNAAKGRVQSAVALTRQSEVTLSETARNAATSVVVAFEGVRNTLLQLQKAQESVRDYQAALDGEREKFRLHRNSLVDVLTVEDRLTDGVVNEVNARLAYATALVQLRQATGTIVNAGQDVLQVDPHIFSELPPPTLTTSTNATKSK